MAVARSPLSFIGRTLLISLALWCVFSAIGLKLHWISEIYQNYPDPVSAWWEGSPKQYELISLSILLETAWFDRGGALFTAIWLVGTGWLIVHRFGSVRHAYSEYQKAQRIRAAMNREAAEDSRRREAAAASAKLQQDRQNHSVAVQNRQRRLAQLEDEVLNLWTDFELSRDFAGRLNPDELRREFRRRLAGLGVPDIGLLRESVSPRVRDVVGNGGELPPGPASLPPPP